MREFNCGDERLLYLGTQKVVAADRTPKKLSQLQARGVEVRTADFASSAPVPSTCPASDGIDIAPP